MFHPLSRVLPALVAVLLAVTAFAQAPAGDLRASQLHDRPVVDGANQAVGAIRGFEFDAASGQLVSVLVALGGARDQAARLPLASPLDLARTPWVVKPTRKQLLSQPEAPPAANGVRATSELMGSELKDPSGATIGRVEDIVISADGKVKLVVASFVEAWYPDKGLVAVPWTSFDPAAPALVAKFSADHIAPAGKPRAPPTPAVPVKPVAEFDVRVANVIGRAVEDKTGRSLGKIEDLVLDPAGRRVTAVVVSAEGRRTAIPLPLAAVKFDDRVLVLDAAPANAAAPAPDAVLATRLLQARLRSPKGDAVGTLRDVVVNLGTGSLRYAVAVFDPSWVGAGMVVAMPIGNVKRNGDALEIAVDRNVLQSGMMIEEAHWKAATAEQYREYANKYIKGL